MAEGWRFERPCRLHQPDHLSSRQRLRLLWHASMDVADALGFEPRGRLLTDRCLAGSSHGPLAHASVWLVEGWRKRRDSNPCAGSAPTICFPSSALGPLGHASAGDWCRRSESNRDALRRRLLRPLRLPWFRHAGVKVGGMEGRVRFERTERGAAALSGVQARRNRPLCQRPELWLVRPPRIERGTCPLGEGHSVR